MTVQDAIKNEIKTIYPDINSFYVESENVDECPPYINVNLVDGSPSFPMGTQGRWQITGTDTDAEALTERMQAIIKLFHYKKGEFGKTTTDDGLLIASVGCVLETPCAKGDTGIFAKSIDLKIFYR